MWFSNIKKIASKNFVSRLSVIGQASSIPDTKSLFVCSFQLDNTSAENQDWQEKFSWYIRFCPTFLKAFEEMKAIHNDRG